MGSLTFFPTPSTPPHTNLVLCFSKSFLFICFLFPYIRFSISYYLLSLIILSFSLPILFLFIVYLNIICESSILHLYFCSLMFSVFLLLHRVSLSSARHSQSFTYFHPFHIFFQSYQEIGLFSILSNFFRRKFITRATNHFYSSKFEISNK